MLLCVFLISFIISPSFGARILGIAPVPSYSHQITFRPLWKELSLRGHEVTVITTDPMNNSSLTNLTEIDIHMAYEIWQFNMVKMSQSHTFNIIGDIVKTTSHLIDEVFQEADVQKLIKNESKRFDLVMSEYFYPATYAFAEKSKCPLIAIGSLDASTDVHQAIGNPTHPVLYPDFILPHSGKMTFFERLTNTLMSLMVGFMYKSPHYHAQQVVVQKHFGEHYSDLNDIAKNISMLFVNTDNIFHQIRPHLPSVVQFGGGTHLTPPKPLPKDLQKVLDNATQGFIFFSLGSNVRSKDLPETTRQVILETLAELPYLVLWKFELEDLPGKPNNVIISKWFPQQDILRHPHIKLFITHGGQQSMEEAVYSHVPLVGMPFTGDQPSNVKKFVSKGFGLSVDYNSLDKISFKSKILEVINNSKYRNRVKELVELIRDQPMTGLERAIWWTEYVLRHKGAQHLRSAAADLPLYQYLLLDVIAFCLLIIVVAIYLIRILIKFVFKALKCFKSKEKVKIQ